jgi:hypothetical protein
MYYIGDELMIHTTDNILEAILPEIPEDEKETPAGFAAVGHVGK